MAKTKKKTKRHSVERRLSQSHQNEPTLPQPEPTRASLDPPESPANRAQQLALLSLDDVAFDEMNIVETPFALLTNDTKAHTSLSLSPGGHERLVTADSVLGLPNSLAEPTVLGLMWLSMREHRFTSPVTRFSLRNLVCNYVFPGRYVGTYTPSQKILKAVEQQLNCVANTRIFTDRWYDRSLKKRTKMNAAIIDYVQVIDEGGKNRPGILEVRWGAQFYKSIVEQYTKPIDPALFHRISNPLDRRLYRWLDRQLALKERQEVRSCQNFARFKLLMTGQKLNAGGRTASSYIAKRLEESLERLDGLGFAVRLEVDSSHHDFSFVFIRLAVEGPNEVVIEDKAGELVCEFQLHAHGIPRSAKRRRLPKSDREEAARWIEAYGVRPASWMVQRCVEIQRSQRAEKILTFKGLARYEHAALGDYDRHRKKEAGQLELEIEKCRDRRWERYQKVMLRCADEGLTPADLAVLEKKATSDLAEELGSDFVNHLGYQRVLDVHLRKRKLEVIKAIGKDEFYGYSSEEALSRAITERHGADPTLGGSTER